MTTGQYPKRRETSAAQARREEKLKGDREAREAQARKLPFAARPRISAAGKLTIQ